MKCSAIFKSVGSLIAVTCLMWGCTGGGSSPAGATGGTAATNASIFTTDAICDGTVIDEFAEKDDVYIDGTGVPGQSYYVQVTEPGPHFTVLGTSLTVDDVLGSTPIFVGGDGLFDGCYNLSAIVRSSTGDGSADGFDDTDNSGGEYKVWISLDPTFPTNDSVKYNFKI
ncbi:MAG: hypothetical protein IID08_01710 [Candidatus Hydrogenedentes bacterium]|nr:hypothetical protein [Candidatus Hydrogenedentota bacterium]